MRLHTDISVVCGHEFYRLQLTELYRKYRYTVQMVIDNVRNMLEAFIFVGLINQLYAVRFVSCFYGFSVIGKPTDDISPQTLSFVLFNLLATDFFFKF